MSTLTDQDLDTIEQEASSSTGDYGRSPALLALVAECRQHRARMARLEALVADLRKPSPDGQSRHVGHFIAQEIENRLRGVTP